MKGNPGKCLHGSISILPTETFPFLAVWAPGPWQGSLISCPIQHMVLLSVVNVQTFTKNYRASEKGWRRSLFHFLSCRVPGLLMQSASTSRVFTIYTVHYLTVQDYFHYWDWQAASCQDRTRVFFRVSLNAWAFLLLAQHTDTWLRRHTIPRKTWRGELTLVPQNFYKCLKIWEMVC